MDKTLRLIALLLFASPLWGQTILGPIREPFAAASGGGITYVRNGTGCSMVTGATGSCTITISPNTGDNAQIGVGLYATSNLITAINWEPSGTSCSIDGSYVYTAQSEVAIIGTCTNAPSSQTGIQVTCTGACYFDTNAAEFSGELTSSPLDVLGTGNFGDASSSTWDSGSINTLNANDVVVGVFYGGASLTSFTPTSPWNTGFYFNDVTNGAVVILLYQIVSSASSYNPTGTADPATVWSGLTSSYK